MADYSSVIKNELDKLPPDRRCSLRDDNTAWLCCPYHGGGFEKTPSAKINLDYVISPKGKVPPGHFYCFACSVSEPWNKFAEKYGLIKFEGGDLIRGEAIDIFSSEDLNNLLGEESEEIKLPNDAVDWPEHMMWRTINGQVVRDIGGKIYFDHTLNQTGCILPAYVNKTMVGYVRAKLAPTDDNIPNYRNSYGTWAKETGLFPYDYVYMWLRELPYRERFLLLTEGPRDALNLIQWGIPSLCTLGTTWSKRKRDLILNMEPKLIVTAFDPDDAGEKLQDRAKKSFYRQADVRNLKFKVRDDGKKEMDASDLSKKQCRKLIRHYREIMGVQEA